MLSSWSYVCQSVSLSVRPSVFSFPDDNLSKYQWIISKLGMCIDIVEIWFGIANGQMSSIFTELCARHTVFICLCQTSVLGTHLP